MLEATLHLTVVYAIHQNQIAFDNLSKTTLLICLLLKGALFSSKYNVYYGLSLVVNKLVGMETTPLPKCIALIHTNGELWKYFDTGIYEFIKKYFLNYA